MDVIIFTNGGIGDQIQYSSLIAEHGIRGDKVNIFCHPELAFFHESNPNVTNILSEVDNVKVYDIGYNFAIKTELAAIFSETPIKKRIGYIDVFGKIAATNQAAKELMHLALDKNAQSPKTLAEWFCEIAGVIYSPISFYINTNNFDCSPDIVIQYKTNVPDKDWGLDQTKAIVDRFKDKEVWITTHDKNKEELEGIGCKVLSGSIGEITNTAELISRSKLLVTPDTATFNLGVALGIPTIILTNGYDRGFCIPKNNNKVTVIKGETMNDISTDVVIEAITRRLDV